MYVAVKGGETAILNSYRLLADQRRGDPAQPELGVAQIREQLKLAVDRVMTEGSVYDPELAALAIKQASGDLVEAIFLLRARDHLEIVREPPRFTLPVSMHGLGPKLIDALPQSFDVCARTANPP